MQDTQDLLGADFLREESLEKLRKDFSTALMQDAQPLPLTQLAADGEMRDTCLVGYTSLGTSKSIPAELSGHACRQVSEHSRQPLPCRVAGDGEMDGPIPIVMLRHDQPWVVGRVGVRADEGLPVGAVRRQHGVILDCFGAS